MKLKPKRRGYSSGLDRTIVDPSNTNEFAAAAFRFGHSMIGEEVSHGPSKHKLSTDLLKDVTFRLSFLHQNLGMMDHVVNGMLFRPSETVDPYFSSSIHNRLFETPSSPGLDLPAFNIQRGRDHGLQRKCELGSDSNLKTYCHNASDNSMLFWFLAYVAYRKKCNLPEAGEDWQGLKSLMTQKSIDILKGIYKSPKDIDLYVGGLFEKWDKSESMVGPTFRCIIGKFFKK